MRRSLAAMSLAVLISGVGSTASANTERPELSFGLAPQQIHQGHAVTHSAKRQRHVRPPRGERTQRYAVRMEGHGVIGGRPSGCPRRFCGCALSIKLFGKIIPSLNLAANWKAFPQAAPAPGMVAARYGHVFQLVSHAAGNIWTVWDANSGGGRIRFHQRSIAGYSIHNPHGSLASVNHAHRRHGKRVRYASAR